ncbi:transposase, Ptta/En/Spm [Tanacetum coccineum]
MRCVRKTAMKATKVNDNVDIRRIGSNRPNWIGANDWPTMVKAWDTDEWRLKLKVAKENRSKSQSGKHTAGSRSFLHTKIVMYSRILSEKHLENEENAEIDKNGNKSPLDDFNV